MKYSLWHYWCNDNYLIISSRTHKQWLHHLCAFDGLCWATICFDSHTVTNNRTTQAREVHHYYLFFGLLWIWMIFHKQSHSRTSLLLKTSTALPRMCSDILPQNWPLMELRIDATMSTLKQVLLWPLTLGHCSQRMTCCLRMLSSVNYCGQCTY